MDNQSQSLSIPNGFFFKGQMAQLVVQSLLIVLVYYSLDWEQLSRVSLWGIAGNYWAVVAIAIAPIHQFFVWFVWRSELVRQSISPLFGGRGFRVYGVLFGIMLFSRPILMVLLGLADYGSIAIHWSLLYILAPIIAVIGAYTLFSVHSYFGFERAIGGDHFYEKYREGFVKKGIFKYVSNAMYGCAFLLFFLIGILTYSKAVLLIATFHYLSIWTHYFCLEKPDIEVIYAK